MNRSHQAGTTHPVPRSSMKPIYVLDAHRGGPYGFSPTLREVTSPHPELDVDDMERRLAAFASPRSS
ncbi:hypothetical protein [Streptomyces sp. NPDC060002]|uniref:hypothetical protein n=1 Tax=Streptomyces sp. NPDC060002 TaxID=3347033 RepID=UPI0036900286